MTETQDSIEEKINRMGVIIQTQKNEIHNLSIRLNDKEKNLLYAYSKLDELGAALISIIRDYGDEGRKIKLNKRTMEQILPGTFIQDCDETEDSITIEVIEVKNIEDIKKASEPKVELIDGEKENANL